MMTATRITARTAREAMVRPRTDWGIGMENSSPSVHHGGRCAPSRCTSASRALDSNLLYIQPGLDLLQTALERALARARLAQPRRLRFPAELLPVRPRRIARYHHTSRHVPRHPRLRGHSGAPSDTQVVRQPGLTAN